MNQVAEKIEVKVEESYEISLMPSDRLTLVWQQCEKLLEKSCKRSNGRSTPQDVFYDCLNNRASLWIIFDTYTLDIIGCSITKINQYPTGKRMLNIDHVTGKKMDKWAVDRLITLRQLNKENRNLMLFRNANFIRARAHARYYSARYYMSVGNVRKAKSRLLTIRDHRPIYYFLWFMAHSLVMWNLIHKRSIKAYISRFFIK